MKIFLLLLFTRVASPVKHSLKFYLTASSGVSGFPEFVAVATVNEAEIAYYDSNIKRTEPKQDWMKTIIGAESHHWEKTRQNCANYQQMFKAETNTFKQRFNQTGGVHVVQEMAGCEWDDETGEVSGYQQYGFNGEDFISMDLKTLTWIAPKPQAVFTKHKWDGDKSRNEFWKNFVLSLCPEKLKKYLKTGKSSLQRTERPSVSLLQKTPSSPLSCHATGFYPDRAVLLWRKDGEELHEDVEHGEILPNHDGTFQMSVDLNISSVTPEDWGRYECVFHLSGAEDIIVTKLDEAAIRTNEERPTDMTSLVTAAVVVLAVVVFAFGVTVYKKKQTKCPPCPPDDISADSLSEKLNPET
ncbi:major histocompatibility complex class I-related gene protein-like [Toxotes jaculatrix]|uniref:major histocompatibility complex class I-related gene protein-like n=1 Tax=Toxotes jaculatrix TaxID=941984 RepID=UPI001B3A91D0|nr:major histocompatibility complex class I-related gene protein-like [Toxotes jaculatrix]